MKRFACIAILFAAACGDNDEHTPMDAQNIDAQNIDAPPPIDAPATTYSATMTALEVAVLNPPVTGQPPSFFGQGLQIGISFQDSETGVAPIMEEMPGSPLGCKLYEFNQAQAVQATLGNNEGNVTVTVTDQMIPTCVHMPTTGYICPHNGTASTGGIIAAGPMPGTATLTDADTTFNADNSTGRYVSISGATNAANNGAFPILAVLGPNVILYGNPARVAENIPATGSHVNLAGVGPIPGAAAGFIANDAAASFALTPGGGNHFQAFTHMTADIGDDFTMPDAELAKLNAIPTNGAAFTITCDGGTCGTASGSLLNIVTTDAPTAGLSPFAFPIPTTKRVQIRCAAIGATSVTVPAAYSAALMNSGYTRIQATFMRPALMAGGPANVNAIGGHAKVGFTNRPVPPQ